MFLLIFFASLALGLSFLCSVAEAVLLCTTRSYIASMEQKKKQSGRLLRELKNNIDRPLAAILTLNTMANTMGAAGVGAEAALLFGHASLGIASGILAFLILVFSEIIPKTLGAVHWRRLAPLVARFVYLLIWIMYPFVLLSKLLSKVLSRKPVSQGVYREEFRAMADLGAQAGHLEAKEWRILRNLFRFPSLKVRDIMTPRTVVFSLQRNMTVQEVIEKHIQVLFSRMPIYKDHHEDIVGFVLKSDVLLAQAQRREETRLLDIMRELQAVPESATLSSVFETLLNRQEHILLVVDEYGGMAGIVTLEDLVETLLGLEIVDEADRAVNMQALARAQWEERARRIGLISKERLGTEKES